MKTIIVANTKGGAGKTTTSTMLLPLFATEENINIYEIDNNNTTSLLNSTLNFKNIRVKDVDGAVDDVYFDSLEDDKNTLNIIDCGGGDDTKAVLEELKNTDMEGLTYVIPANSDIEQFENVKNTIELIKETDKKPKIHLLLNQISSNTEAEIKKEFLAFFGDEDIGIKGRIGEIEADIKEIHFIRTSRLFTILKNIYKTSLRDSYRDSLNLKNNLKEILSEAQKKGRDEFRKVRNQEKFSRQILTLVEEIESLKTILKG